MRQFLARALPGLASLGAYRRVWLRSDIVAGMTVFAVSVPSVIAYAQLAGVPAVTGLYAALVAMLCYALLGTSRQLIMGPEATSAIIVASVLAPLTSHGDPARHVALASMLALMVGLIAIGAGLLKVGFLADFFSKPLLTGYTLGTGLIILASQLGRLLGVRLENDDFFPRLLELAGKLDQIHPLTLALGGASIAFILILRRFARKAPGSLALVALMTVASVLLDLKQHGLAVVGLVPTGLPVLAWPAISLADLRDLLLPALSLSLIVFADVVLTARLYARRNGYEIDASQELVALGACNMAAGLTGGFTVAASGSRTVVNDDLGNKSQLSGMVAAALIVPFLLFFTPALSELPTVALASIIFVAAFRLIDVPGMMELARMRRSEFGLALVTIFGVLTVGILQGILFTVALSMMIMVARTARPYDAVLVSVEGIDRFHAVDRVDSVELMPGLIVYRFHAPLFFANAQRFQARVKQLIERARQPVRWVLISAEPIIDIDSSAAEIIHQLDVDLNARGIELRFAGASPPLKWMLGQTGLTDQLGEHAFYSSVNIGVKAYLHHLKQNGPQGD